MKLRQALFGMMFAALACAANAQNNTPGTAVNATIDNDWANTYVNAGQPVRWYYVYFVQGRSYCIATTYHPDLPDVTSDTYVEVYTTLAGTVLFQGVDDNVSEPVPYYYSRNCFIWTLPTNLTVIRIRHLDPTPSTTYYMRWKIYDTTIFGPWAFNDTANGYNGFIELRNTTNSTVSFTATLRSSTGAVLGTPIASSIPGNGNRLINSRVDFGGVFNGGASVDVAHNGAPGAIAGNITSLSGVTGLSFDSPMTRRSP